jgi:L-ascorbate metabolism protein UlaG (beta-lactamase superfamily)
MKTSIQFNNHASVIIKGTNISLLSDPWYQGDAFHKGWNLLYELSDDQIINILNKVTHIWISHEHPDHFSVSFFKKFSRQINAKK